MSTSDSVITSVPPKVKVPGENPLLKISKDHDVKTTAGFIAHSIRREESPKILCAQPQAVNQSIKSLAIARSYLLKDNLFFTTTPASVISKETNRQRVNLFLIPTSVAPQIAESETILKASGTTDPSTIAGAIAKKVRAGERPTVSAIGAEAVFRAVIGISIANKYLRDDQTKVSFVVEFKHIGEENESRSAIYFYILPEKSA